MKQLSKEEIIVGASMTLESAYLTFEDKSIDDLTLEDLRTIKQCVEGTYLTLNEAF